MNYLCELRWESSCALRKISHTELILLIMAYRKSGTRDPGSLGGTLWWDRKV